jgi:hypothetical protein
MGHGSGSASPQTPFFPKRGILLSNPRLIINILWKRLAYGVRSRYFFEGRLFLKADPAMIHE